MGKWIKHRLYLAIALLFVILCFWFSMVHAQSSANYSIKIDVTSGGGGEAISPSYQLQSAVGQPFISEVLQGINYWDYEGFAYPAFAAIFSDVYLNYWAYGYVMGIYHAEITRGCGGDEYCPGNSVTREQMAAFLVRAKVGEPPADYCNTGSPFGDVLASSPFCKYIKKLMELNITQGCAPGMYCPTDNALRQQMAAFIVRAVEGEPPLNYCDTGIGFTDVEATSVFCKYIKKLVELGVTQGCAAGIYCPANDVVRDQMAAFLARAFLGM